MTSPNPSTPPALACAFSPDKLLSSLSTSVRCAGRVAPVAATVSGIPVRYWACEAHAAEDGRASSDVYAAWRAEDIKSDVPATYGLGDHT